MNDFVDACADYYIYFLLTAGPVTLTAFKLAPVLAFLMLIRAGLPRYRYDYLTKLGWVKFLSFMAAVIIIYYLGFTL